ncbi:cytochrome C oxidase subunit IV family protein [Haloparvum sedimenti]|uniref:cytochrome C oxidase subunit IV family protein n=1 Tax=Haloparvum sedimenti TaxID=1678448 RepID=UPI00071E8C9B|nr:cytochrome C oxidase subunit IV family protein [Haloparvum sedimenti]
MASDSIKLYSLVYAGLVGLAALNYVLFEGGLDLAYDISFVGTMVIAVLKTALVVAFFMHLKWENRSLTYLMVLALVLTLLLMSAATYSIT